MKTFAIIAGLLLLFATGANCQTDSTSLRLDAQQQAINTIAMNLAKCDRTFQSGLMVTSLGLLTTTVGFIAYAGGSENGSDAPAIVMASGGLVSLVGTIMMWNSHKYIGKAGRVRVEGNAVVVNF